MVDARRGQLHRKIILTPSRCLRLQQSVCDSVRGSAMVGSPWSVHHDDV